VQHAKVAGSDALFAGDRHSFHGIFEFTHVAGPTVGLESPYCVFGEDGRSFAKFHGCAAKEVVGEWLDVRVDRRRASGGRTSTRQSFRSAISSHTTSTAVLTNTVHPRFLSCSFP
jgi:hypothetical protein